MSLRLDDEHVDVKMSLSLDDERVDIKMRLRLDDEHVDVKMGLRLDDEHKVKDGADYVLTVLGVHTAVAVGAGRGRGGYRLPHTRLLGLIPGQLLSAPERRTHTEFIHSSHTHTHTHTHKHTHSLYTVRTHAQFIHNSHTHTHTHTQFMHSSHTDTHTHICTHKHGVYAQFKHTHTHTNARVHTHTHKITTYIPVVQTRTYSPETTCTPVVYTHARAHGMFTFCFSFLLIHPSYSHTSESLRPKTDFLLRRSVGTFLKTSLSSCFSC